VTVIDGGKTGTVVKGAEGATVRGFTITNSGPEHECSGIKCYDCTMTIADNIIAECTIGIYLWRSSSHIVNNIITKCGNKKDNIVDFAVLCNRSTPYIANNLVVDNLECGIYICWQESNDAQIVNNTIANNGGEGIWCYRSSPSIVNNISVGNVTGFSATHSSRPRLAYNNAWGNTWRDYNEQADGKLIFVSGNISSDPMFVDPSKGNYCLLPGSPCIDRGDPALRDSDGSRSDMGAYGGMEAMPSLTCPKPNEPPVASFTWEAISPEGARILVKPRTCDFVRFDASSSHDPDGKVTKYEWDWETDGKFDLTTTEPVVEHVFDEPGTYRVTLRVTDDKGATATATETITVVERKPPQADFSFSPVSPTVQDTVEFTDNSRDPDGKIVSWHWEFGDGTTSTERNPTHRYTRKGIFTVKLTVTDNDGLTDTEEKEIEVVNVPPKASFTFDPKEPYAGQEISFDASGSEDPDGKIVGYSWDFGDGEVGEGIEVKHVFEKPGTYTVTLTVTDEDGAKATVEREIVVEEREEVFVPKEVWGLIIGISDYEEEGLDLGCARADAEALRDILLSIGVPKEHLLVLLDNAASLISVREGLLWLMKNAGEEDLVIFYFSGHGYQGMDLKPNDERDGLDEYFVVHDTNRSTIEATALRDDEFGQFLDGIRSKHVLVFFDSCYSGGLPRGQRGLPRGGSPKGPLDFFNDFDPEGKLVLAASAENQLSWEDPKLGHGVFTYFLIEGLKGEADLDGDYKVTVKELSAYLKEKVPKYVEKNFGVEQEPQLIGKGTALVEIAKRNRPPTANFTYWPEVPFPGKEVQFQDTSTDDGTITAWSWDFGDGATSTDQHPTHAYAEPGTYTVTLTVMDDGGLSSGTEAKVLVGPPGLVTTVAEAQGLVIISLGSRNGVDVGDRFEVVRPYKISEGTVIEERRAIIEVIAVLGPDRSVCKVLQLFFPVAVKDLVQPIGNPLH